MSAESPIVAQQMTPALVQTLANRNPMHGCGSALSLGGQPAANEEHTYLLKQQQLARSFVALLHSRNLQLSRFQFFARSLSKTPGVGVPPPQPLLYFHNLTKAFSRNARSLTTIQ